MRHTSSLAFAVLFPALVQAVSIPRAWRDLRIRAEPVDPTNIPVECQTQCMPLLNGANACTDNVCLCTSAIGVAYRDCLNCWTAILLRTDPNAIVEGQAAINSYEEMCSAAGNPLSSSLSITPVTPPGASPSSSSVPLSPPSGSSSSTLPDTRPVSHPAEHSTPPVGPGHPTTVTYYPPVTVTVAPSTVTDIPSTSSRPIGTTTVVLVSGAASSTSSVQPTATQGAQTSGCALVSLPAIGLYVALAGAAIGMFL